MVLQLKMNAVNVVVTVHHVKLQVYPLEHLMLQDLLKFYMILVAMLLVSSLMYLV